jgi:hypothetical protein
MCARYMFFRLPSQKNQGSCICVPGISFFRHLELFSRCGIFLILLLFSLYYVPLMAMRSRVNHDDVSHLETMLTQIYLLMFV